MYSLAMDKTTPVWRPLFPHLLRPEARRAGAEYDIGPGEFANLCTRYVLDRLGKLPEAFALDDDEKFVTAGWDLAYSSLELKALEGTGSGSLRRPTDRVDHAPVCPGQRGADHG